MVNCSYPERVRDAKPAEVIEDILVIGASILIYATEIQPPPCQTGL